MTEPSRRLGDTLFALFHLGLLLAIAGYAVVSLVRGNTWRFLVLAAGLVLYYVLVLHSAVKADIERRRKKRLESGYPRMKP